MYTELKLHLLQKELIKKLSFQTHIRFNELLIEGLESEHMNYHLQRLIEFGLVDKNDIFYSLTDKGKDFSNLLDDKLQTIERQPKSSIIIRGARLNEHGKIEHLLNKRLKQPYYGKVGRITGKVRFGETFQETAERELYEETGLKAKKFVLEEIYRKMRYREDGNYVQDVIFYIFFVTDFTGAFIQKTSFQENFWMTKEVVFQQKLDVYDDLDLEERLTPKPLTLREDDNIVEGF